MEENLKSENYKGQILELYNLSEYDIETLNIYKYKVGDLFLVDSFTNDFISGWFITGSEKNVSRGVFEMFSFFKSSFRKIKKIKADII